MRHQLPNARGAIAGAFLLAAQGAVSSLAIVEYVFGWFGAGFAFIHAVANARFPIAALLFVGFASILGVLAVALALAARLGEPRLRVARW